MWCMHCKPKWYQCDHCGRGYGDSHRDQNGASADASAQDPLVPLDQVDGDDHANLEPTNHGGPGSSRVGDTENSFTRTLRMWCRDCNPEWDQCDRCGRGYDSNPFSYSDDNTLYSDDDEDDEESSQRGHNGASADASAQDQLVPQDQVDGDSHRDQNGASADASAQDQLVPQDQVDGDSHRDQNGASADASAQDQLVPQDQVGGDDHANLEPTDHGGPGSSRVGDTEDSHDRTCTTNAQVQLDQLGSGSLQTQHRVGRYICSVCCDAEVNIVFSPCNHACVCNTCYRKLMKNECPFCKTRIDNTTPLEHMMGEYRMAVPFTSSSQEQELGNQIERITREMAAKKAQMEREEEARRQEELRAAQEIERKRKEAQARLEAEIREIARKRKEERARLEAEYRARVERERQEKERKEAEEKERIFQWWISLKDKEDEWTPLYQKIIEEHIQIKREIQAKHPHWGRGSQVKKAKLQPKLEGTEKEAEEQKKLQEKLRKQEEEVEDAKKWWESLQEKEKAQYAWRKANESGAQRDQKRARSSSSYPRR